MLRVGDRRSTLATGLSPAGTPDDARWPLSQGARRRAPEPVPAGAGRTRRQALLGTAAVTLLDLSACSRSGSTGEAKAGSATACRGTIEFISPWNVGSTAGDALVQLGQDFATAHPGCTAQLLFVSGDNTQILEKLVATIAGGSQPPVALVPAQQTPLWISKGVLQPLETWAKRDGVTKDLFFDGYWPQMVVGGRLWRLPFQIDVNFPWFHNRQTFEAAGLNADQIPRTIDEVDALAIKLTRGAAGAHDQLGFVPWQLYGETNSLQTWAYAFGGELYDSAADKVIANHPQTVAALEWMIDWARRLGGYDAVQGELQAMGGWSTGFALGKIAMAVQTSQAIPSLRSTNAAVQLTGGLFPAGKGIRPGEATWLSGRGIGMVAGAKDPEAAWTFIKWAGATKEGTLAAVNRLAATPGLKASPGLAVLEQDAQLKPFVDSLRVAKHTPPGALIPIDLWAGDRGGWIKEALQQKRSAQQALDDVARSAQVDLDAERARQKR